MEVKVKVLIEAPGIIESLLAVADVFDGYKKELIMIRERLDERQESKLDVSVEKSEKEEALRRDVEKYKEVDGENEEVRFGDSEKASKVEVDKKSAMEGEKFKAEVKEVRDLNSKKVISLEQVRSALVELTKGGEGLKARTIIENLGFKKLVDVPSEHYSEILEKAKNAA